MFSTTARIFALGTIVLSFAITGCSNTRCYLADRSCCTPCSCGPQTSACFGHGGLDRYRGPCDFASAYRQLWQNYCFERHCPPIDELVGPPCVMCGTGPDKSTDKESEQEDTDTSDAHTDSDSDDDLQDVSHDPVEQDELRLPAPPRADSVIREAGPVSDAKADSPEAPLPPNIIPTQDSSTNRDSSKPASRSGRLSPKRFLVAARPISRADTPRSIESVTINLSRN